MANIPNAIALFESSLAQGLQKNDTKMYLVSLETRDGVQLNNGQIYGFTLNEGTSFQEFVLGTVNISDNSIENMTRGISVVDGKTSINDLKFTHRRNTSVKITDHPILTVVSRILNGAEELPSVLRYEPGITPSSPQDLASVWFVLEYVNGGPITLDSFKLPGIAGENIAQGDVVFLDPTDGLWYKALASDPSKVYKRKLAIAQGTGTTGNAIANGVQTDGLDASYTYDTGSVYYIQDDATIGDTPGTNSQVIGFGDANNKLVMFINEILDKNTADALSGGARFGTPSDANKFLTETGGSSVVKKYVTPGAHSWTKPTDPNFQGIWLEILGAGGGGGGGVGRNNNSAISGNLYSGGGGGGAGWSGWIPAIDIPGGANPITIGAGGAGGAGGYLGSGSILGNNGTNGGATEFLGLYAGGGFGGLGARMTTNNPYLMGTGGFWGNNTPYNLQSLDKISHSTAESAPYSGNQSSTWYNILPPISHGSGGVHIPGGNGSSANKFTLSGEGIHGGGAGGGVDYLYFNLPGKSSIYGGGGGGAGGAHITYGILEKISSGGLFPKVLEDDKKGADGGHRTGGAGGGLRKLNHTANPPTEFGYDGGNGGAGGGGGGGGGSNAVTGTANQLPGGNGGNGGNGYILIIEFYSKDI